jgi:hypothetical protein
MVPITEESEMLLELLRTAIPDVAWAIEADPTMIAGGKRFIEVLAVPTKTSTWLRTIDMESLKLKLAIIDGTIFFGGCGEISLADPESILKLQEAIKHCLSWATHHCDDCKILTAKAQGRKW